MMNIEKTAKILNIHPIALSNILAEGRMHGEKVKGMWKIPKEEIDRYLAVRYEHMEGWIDIHQVAKILRKSPKSVRGMIKRGEIKAEYDPLCQTRKFWINRKRLEPMIRVLSKK